MSVEKNSSTGKNPTDSELREYHYNAYKNLIKIALFLNAAGITGILAVLGLKTQPADPHASYLVSPKDPFEEILFSALDHLLLSILMIVLWALIEYLSYWPKRSYNESTVFCCFHEFLIKAFDFIIFITLFLSYIFLIIGGIQFRYASI